MKKFKTLSIIIPVYNEEKFIETTVERVLAANSLNLKKEIIIIDDASSDKTPEILHKMEKKYKKNILVIFKKSNEGKGAALKTGFQKTLGDIVLVQVSLFTRLVP